MSEELNVSVSTQETPQQEPEQAKRPYEDAFYWLQTLVTAIVCIVLVFTFAGRITRVYGSSMEPTLTEGELLLVWSLGYEPKAGDIVVCNNTTATFLGGDAIIKRVIATEGQTVDIDYGAGLVYVDGVALDEPYTLEEMRMPLYSDMQQTHFEVPEGSVFLMGDNRNNSTDSRHDLLGPVDKDYLLGKAVFVFFPLSRFGLL